MIQYIFISILLFSFFSTFFFDFFKNNSHREFGVKVIFAIILTLLFKYDWGFSFFGLEYEDSYVFNFVARQYANNIFSSSFLTDGIVLGSILDPVSMGTYGGHFITYPILSSWIIKVFGYSPLIPSYLNSFIECLSILILSMFPSNKGKQWWLIPILYCLAPIMNLFGTSQLSETFSSFICLTSVYSLYCYIDTKKRMKIILFCLSFFIALLTKRENLLLFLIPVSLFVIEVVRSKKITYVNIKPVLYSFAIIILYFLVFQNVFKIEETESNEMQVATFSFDYFLRLFPIFINSLFRFSWFSITTWIIMIVPLYMMVKRRYEIIILFVLYLAYLFIYCFHYRSYYFVFMNNVNPFESLRYLNNFFYLNAIICGIGINRISKLKRKHSVMLICSLVVLSSFSLFSTYKLRRDFSQIEHDNRFQSTKKVLKFMDLQHNSVLISDNILLFQILGSNSMFVCDLKLYDRMSSMLVGKNCYLYLSAFNQTDDFKNRHPNIENSLQLLSLEKVMLFKDKSVLYRIND